MSQPLAAQIYTVRDRADRDFPGTLESIAAMGYDGVELVGLHGLAPAEFLSHVERLGLQVIGGSLPFLDDDDILAHLEEMKAIRCDTVFTHLSAEHFVSPESTRNAAELCNRFVASLRKQGISFGYHNHWWEFAARADGQSPIWEFTELLDSDIFLLVDTYWVATAGLDVAAALKELGTRVRRLHLKDGPCTRTDPQTVLGDGNVDIPAVVAAAPQADWLVVELDEYAGDPLDALAESHVYMTERVLPNDLSQS